MRKLLRAAAVTAVLALTLSATPRAAQAEDIFCQIKCLSLSLACVATTESVSCLFFWEGCLDGCNYA